MSPSTPTTPSLSPPAPNQSDTHELAAAIRMDEDAAFGISDQQLEQIVQRHSFHVSIPEDTDEDIFRRLTFASMSP